MLTFAEELLLLALDDKKGVIKPLPCHSMRFALTGALLMELAMAGRIDTDLDSLQVINPEPTGNQLLDEFLERLKDSDSPRNTEYWLNELAWNTENLQDRTLQQLVHKGILKIEDRKILWVFARRCYPLIDDQEVKEVKTRLREVILSRDIPDPRDAVLISLIQSCNLFKEIFTQEELERVMPWITNLAKLDLIGREVNQSIHKIFLAMTSSSISY
ncbi:MAG: GOLPH3/VPS74 family protein [Desulfonatronovibrio sp.]